MAERPTQRRLAAVLAADVAGYTRLMERDTDGTVAAWQEAREAVVKPTVTRYSGKIVKLTGDGFLVEFPTVQDAVNCAIAMQAGLADSTLKFRMGVNLGDIVDDGEDIHGEGVNVAARLEALAEPGGILISGGVYDQVRNRIDAVYEDLGLKTVKNVSAPVQAWALGRDGSRSVPAESRTSAPPALPDRPSLAVLPFQNLSNDPEQEYFSDGIAGDITIALGRIRQFFVISRNTTLAYKSQTVDARAVARELGVRYVLEGSVRKAGNRVRVSARLSESVTGNQLWAERFDRDLEDIFEVQDEITENVVGAIEPALTRAEWERARARNPESLDAWGCVVRAIASIMEFSDEGSARAAKLLERAIEIDSGYARAYGHSAWVAIWRALQGWDDIASALEIARSQSDRGIQLDVNEPWNHIARTFIGFVTRDSELSIESSRKAIALNPSFAYGHSVHGCAFALAGRGADGIAEIELAMRLSPRDIWREEFDLHYAFAQFQIANYDAAARLAESASLPQPGHVYPQLLLASSLGHLGQTEKAQRVLQRLRSHVPGFAPTAAGVAQIYVKDEDHRRLIQGLQKAGVLVD